MILTSLIACVTNISSFAFSFFEEPTTRLEAGGQTVHHAVKLSNELVLPV
jgi:hypothetical protein